MSALKVVHSLYRWLEQTETWIYNQIRFLPPETEAHVVCRRVMNLDQFPCRRLYPLTNVPFWCRNWDRLLCRSGMRHHLGHLVKVARTVNASVLHSHFGHHGWENLEAARKAGLKQVVTFYGLDVNYLPRNDSRWIDRYQGLFDRVDRILCEGPHMARSIALLGAPAGKVRVHHLGVPTAEIRFAPRRWTPGSTLRVLMAAGFREKKGIPYGIEALGRIAKKVDLEVTLIGDANQEPRSLEEKKKIIQTIEGQQLGSKVRLLGYQPYSRLFQEAYDHHLFLAPSVTSGDGDTEGGAPVTLMDMAATGMPIVSTRHCDIPEIVQDGVTGRLAGERNVEGLVEQIRGLLREPDSWEEMVAAGRSRMETEFDAVRQARKLQSIYETLGKEDSPGESSHVEGDATNKTVLA